MKKSEKTEFLSYFYRKSMRILLTPLLANTSGGKIIRGLFSFYLFVFEQSKTKSVSVCVFAEDFLIAQLQNLILDFLSFCVEHHTYHIKNYVVHKDLLKQILVLLKSKHQFLALGKYM
jgi:protein phosphatase-4 regulatory subunit 3